jgi:hypothetical protein
MSIKDVWMDLSVTCDRSVVFSEYSSFLNQQNWPPRYNWNIVESGAKHHNPNPNSKWNVISAYIILCWYSSNLFYIYIYICTELCLCRPGGQLCWLRKLEYSEKTTDLSQVTDKSIQTSFILICFYISA